MDDQFFQELEESISNVGTDEVWKETIGGREIWLSPISFTGQAKVQDALTSKDSGANIINESKRVLLSNSIVGIDKIDLRPYRSSGSVFGPIDVPGGKKLKVDLPSYIYSKMARWGQQFIDDTFDVFSDRLETHSKNNVKEVKFENAKNPMDELGELMVRVTELRAQLGLPLLVEETPKDVDEAAEFERAERAKNEVEEEEQQSEPFDPFRTVKLDDPPPPAPPRTSAAPVQQVVPSQPDPAPVMTLPVVAPPGVVRRAQSLAEMEGGSGQIQSSPTNPFVAGPSIPSEVIDKPIQRTGPIPPPVIDPKVADKTRNPRFSPPKR